MLRNKYSLQQIDNLTNYAAAAVITIYILLLFRLGFDPDLAILTSFAERLIQGYRFTELYYDTNPPLSIILYIPGVWISQLTGLPIYYSTFIYMTLLMGTCVFLSYRILSKFDWIDGRTRSFIAWAFIITVVMVAGYDYGDRDHPITLGMALFILAQIALFKNIRLSRAILIPALIIGTFLILVKPHYGLVPTVLLAYRFFRKDGFKVLLQGDFLALSIGVLLYAGVLIVFFNDFLTIALMDSLNLYAGVFLFEVYKFVFVFGTLTLVLMAIANSFKQVEKGAIPIINLFGFITLLLLIPYMVQGKGLNYHKIPVFIFWYMTAGVLAYAFLKGVMAEKYVKPLALILLVIMIYNVRGVSPSWLTHGQYKELPLLQTVNKYCPQACNYLIISDTSDDNYRVESYSEHFKASRFSAYWFLGFIYYHQYLKENDLPLTATEEEYNAVVSKYMGMIENDFRVMPPDVIIELKTPVLQTEARFVEFFKDNNAYLNSTFTNDYEIVEELEFDRRLYYPGLRSPVDQIPISKWAVYKRKDFDGYNSKLGPPSKETF